MNYHAGNLIAQFEAWRALRDKTVPLKQARDEAKILTRCSMPSRRRWPRKPKRMPRWRRKSGRAPPATTRFAPFRRHLRSTSGRLHQAWRCMSATLREPRRGLRCARACIKPLYSCSISWNRIRSQASPQPSKCDHIAGTWRSAFLRQERRELMKILLVVALLDIEKGLTLLP